MSSSQAVFSIDLETFQQTPAYRNSKLSIADPVGLDAVNQLLSLLEEYKVTATFFIVGEIAEDQPDLISDIAAAGHEIASHTQTHRLLTDLPKEQRCTELLKSKTTLEQVTGNNVAGFRAPAFTLSSNHWRLLDAAGYTYDSSVVPARRIPGWYGGEFTQRDPTPATAFDTSVSPELVTVPVGVVPGLKTPISGAWLRLFGLTYARAGMRLLARQGYVPVVYIHPWELVNLSGYQSLPRRVSWRTGTWTQRAVERLLQEPFEFVTTQTVATEHRERN